MAILFTHTNRAVQTSNRFDLSCQMKELKDKLT